MKNTSTVLFGVAIVILLMFTVSFAADQPKPTAAGATTNIVPSPAPQLTDLQTKNIIIAYQNALLKKAPKDIADAAFQDAVNLFATVRDENLKSAGFAAGSDVLVNLTTGVVTVTPPPAPPTPSTPPAPTAAPPVTGPAVPTVNKPAEKK